MINKAQDWKVLIEYVDGVEEEFFISGWINQIARILNKRLASSGRRIEKVTILDRATLIPEDLQIELDILDQFLEQRLADESA